MFIYRSGDGQTTPALQKGAIIQSSKTCGTDSVCVCVCQGELYYGTCTWTAGNEPKGMSSGLGPRPRLSPPYPPPEEERNDRKIGCLELADLLECCPPPVDSQL